ncbi:phosphate/phosphite/phosphonate ABC transporter substrate-binding protein [Pseudooceanicola sp. LIPI14-2-Ac024]|uniref:phosphate/phosphite/phosphonate ABC transporter substrate-binding protein n=1 Tax=Pseudooceanicola sp. LIPI14-2-Ac024 TaxID=3344875 RepID=UPI0035D128D6
MYDRPEVGQATNALWAAMRDALREDGIDAPEALTRSGSLWDHWRSPDLVLSQTCGLPYRKALHDHVTLIGTPDFGLPDCPPGYYNSVIVMRRDDPRSSPADWAELRLAYNDSLSQSGWAAAEQTARAEGTRFGSHVETGAHRASVRAVASGAADICFVDAQTWRLMSKWDPLVGSVHTVGASAPVPGLPYISAPGADAAAMAGAVARAIDGLPAEHIRALGITGFVHVPAADYLAVPTPDAPPAA